VRNLIAGLIAGAVLATGTVALAGPSESQKTNPDTRLLARKLDTTNQRLGLLYVKLNSLEFTLNDIESNTAGIGGSRVFSVESRLQKIESHTEKSCAYLRNIANGTRPVVSTCY
jgi:hypothetical protein